MEVETKSVSKVLSSSLPEEIYGPTLKHPESYVQSFLLDELPSSDRSGIDREIKWNFLLDKHDPGLAKKKKKKPHKRKQFLTRKERTEMNLLKLPKEGWNYNQLQNLRVLWMQYMRDNLDGLEKVPTYLDPEWQAFTVVLGKSELIGAEIEVVKSNVPSLIGKKGTVVLETKCTIQIITPDNQLKVLLKPQSVFAVELDGVRFTIFGKCLCTKPSERSVKKLKSLLYPEL